MRVVLADDNELMRHGVASLLQSLDDIDLVAECVDKPSLMQAVADHEPDIVVTDIRMPPSGTNEGIAAALAIRAAHATTGVVVLSQYAEPEFVLDLFENGSDGLGYLLKDKVTRFELSRAISAVAAGESAVDATIVDVLVQGRRADSPLTLLTPREVEVLGCIAEGRNNAAVASELTISHKAVSNHINAIFAKLGLRDEPDSHARVKAVLLFLSAQR